MLNVETVSSSGTLTTPTKPVEVIQEQPATSLTSPLTSAELQLIAAEKAAAELVIAERAAAGKLAASELAAAEKAAWDKYAAAEFAAAAPHAAPVATVTNAS